ISGGVGIGGVLEPLQAEPVIVEDDCFIGARSEVAEGVIVRKGAVLAMGVFLGASTKIVDRDTGETFVGEVPEYAVVVPGTLPPRPLKNGAPGPSTAGAGRLGLLEKNLKTAGFEVHRVTFGEPGTADIDNLYARIGNSGPHITFAGHTDVVPPGDESAWSHGAFSGDVKDGFLYGRGAVDMKGGIACSVAAVLQYLADH